MTIKYEKEKLQEVVSSSKTLREVMKKFGRNDSAGSYRVLKKRIEEWGIDTSNLLNQSEHAKLMYETGQFNHRKGYEEIFCEDSKVSRATVKKRVIDNNYIKYECSDCGSPPKWRNKPLTLILDHINGIRNDNRIGNLRFLCPNCDSQQDTFCKGSSGLVKKEKKKRKYHERPNQRKVKDRPSKKELSEMIDTMTWTAIGKKYNVSDVAVRKWAKRYEIIK